MKTKMNENLLDQEDKSLTEISLPKKVDRTAMNNPQYIEARNIIREAGLRFGKTAYDDGTLKGRSLKLGPGGCPCCNGYSDFKMPSHLPRKIAVLADKVVGERYHFYQR
jgi:hypothetical protein